MRKILLFLSCVIILAIMINVLLNMLGGQSDEDALRGHLYMSMATQGDPLSIYTIDLYEERDKRRIGEFFKFEGNTVMQIETAQISEGTQDVFYVSAPAAGVSQYSKSHIIHMRSGGEVSFLTSLDNELLRERDLDYSLEANKLAFSAQVLVTAEVIENDNQVNSVAAWGIYIVDILTKELTYVSPGRDPQWAPDGRSLIFIGTDGLYSYNQDSGDITEVKFPPGVSFSFGENMNLDIDEAGNKVVISSPNDFALYIGELDGWEVPAVSNVRRFGQPASASAPLAFFWPTLTPNGSYVAVQYAETTTDDDVLQNPSIGIINTKTLELVKSWSIAEYDFDRAFIDEWDY